jgi:hypothetical protein
MHKLDLSKAYGRLVILEASDEKARFLSPDRGVGNDVCYLSKIFGGTLLNSFSPSRGLHQGDYVSIPILFLLLIDFHLF